jgi:hypothetical protein
MIMTWKFEPALAGTQVTITAENVPPGISQAEHDAAFARPSRTSRAI